ncbi:MAG: hypothetical protein IIC56_04915 [Proteobacteria bacterium]|nr:hypothetical protein [Pseudomonadota bacterium]
MDKARACFWAAGAVFVIFVADIFLAKIQVLAGEAIPVHLGDTLQFLVLLVAVTFFVAGTLIREKQEGEAKDMHDGPLT